jgi:hypothetical protein
MDSIDSAAAYASTHPCTRVLADTLGSSALLWHDPWLAGRIGFDARYEQFPPPALMRLLTFVSAQSPRWLGTTTGYRVLIGDNAFSPPLVQRLQHLAGARVLASDRAGIALVTGAGRATTPTPTPTRCAAAA